MSSALMPAMLLQHAVHTSPLQGLSDALPDSPDGCCLRLTLSQCTVVNTALAHHSLYSKHGSGLEDCNGANTCGSTPRCLALRCCRKHFNQDFKCTCNAASKGTDKIQRADPPTHLQKSLQLLFVMLLTAALRLNDHVHRRPRCY